jgi:CheY-like chemotaxis protein
LKRAHFEPVSIEDPMKAVEMAKAGHFDIFFLDINMPGMNGFQLCEKLRKLSPYKDTPMIFITANGDFHNRAQSILSGGNDLIPKPISPAELVLKTTMRLVHPQKMWPAKKNGAVTNSAIVNGALTNGSASNGTHAERPAPPSDPHTNGIPEIAMLPFTVPSETEIFRKTSALDLSSTIEPRKPAAPKASVESPQPVEPEKLTLAAEAKDKLAEPVNSEVDTEIKAEGAPTLKVPSLKMSTSERGGESPRIIEPAPAEAKDEIPNALESIKLAMAHAAKEKAIEPAPAEAKAKDEPIKAREAEKLTLAAEVKEKPADPVISEAKADIKSESPKAETVPVVQPEAFPAAMPEKPVPTQTTSETKHSTKTMETNNKPTIDEAARGVARIIFGDENINDMNVRLTRIALERYTAPGKNLDEISRGVAGIIFGDDKLSDMNVRLTRIALERYNITDVLHLNGSSKPEPVLA